MNALPVLRRKAPPIIFDVKQHVIFTVGKFQEDVLGAGMFGNVAQRFLRHSKETFCQMTAQRSLRFFERQADGNLFTLFEIVSAYAQRAGNAEIVKNGRMEPMSQVSQMVRQLSHLAFDELKGRAGGRREVGDLLHLIVDIERQTDDALVQLIVQFPSDAAPLVVLC